MTNIKYSNRTLKFPRNQFLKIRLCSTTSLKDGNYKPFKHSRLYLHRFLPSCQGSTRWFCSHTLFERLHILGIYVLLVIKENRSHQKRHLSYNHFSHLHKSLQLYLYVCRPFTETLQSLLASLQLASTPPPRTQAPDPRLQPSPAPGPQPSTAPCPSPSENMSPCASASFPEMHSPPLFLVSLAQIKHSFLWWAEWCPPNISVLNSWNSWMLPSMVKFLQVWLN